MLDEAIPPAVNANPHLAESTAGRLRLGRINLEVRQSISAWYQALILGGAVLAGLGISAALLVSAGVKPAALLDEFVVETFTDPVISIPFCFRRLP